MTILGNRISRNELETLYCDYASALDDDILCWPDLFTDDCLYKIVSNENYERNLPLALISCEGRGMLLDRVTAIQKTSFYAPRFFRHIISNIRITENSHETLYVQAHFMVFESFIGDTIHVFNAGRYFDVIVREDNSLKFREKICVPDGSLIPVSLIYPL